MSFRPTITVYIDGEIADLRYYKNWETSDLFFEAIAIAAIFNQCKSIEEYREKKFKSQTVIYLLEPEEIINTQENLKEMEAWSEFPILIDLSAGFIYSNIGCLLPEELARLPSVDSELTFIDEYIDYTNILEHYKFPLKIVSFDEVKTIILESPELQNRLSSDTLYLLNKMKG